jgi:predicted nucleic acid-binding protein
MSKVVVVADAGPLIALSLIAQLDLLRALFARALVPDAVWREVVLGGGPDAPGAQTVAAATWLERRPSPPIDPAVADLGDGEAEAIVLARSLLPTATLLCDERAARRRATALAVPVIGTLGVLVKAKRAGAISTMRGQIEALRSRGVYLADSLVDTALREVGEGEER